MKIICDIEQKTISFDSDQGTNIFREVAFGFTKNGELPVYFNKLSFGFSLFLNNQKVYEDSRPLEGQEYVCTDQKFMEVFDIPYDPINEEHTINVWVKESDKYFENSFNFLLFEVDLEK